MYNYKNDNIHKSEAQKSDGQTNFDKYKNRLTEQNYVNKA